MCFEKICCCPIKDLPLIDFIKMVKSQAESIGRATKLGEIGEEERQRLRHQEDTAEAR